MEVNQSCRDFLQFLCCNSVRADNPIKLVFRFTRISFGLNSIPFILEGTLQIHMSLLTTIFMDDTIINFKDLNTIIMLNNKVKMCLSERRFELRK